jgi:hypothetical protein
MAEMHNMFYPNPITAGDLERQKELIHPEAIFYEMYDCEDTSNTSWETA